MTSPHYPPLSEASLTPFRALEVQLKSVPDLLDRPECPYPPTVKAMLRRLVGGEKVDTGFVERLIDPGDAELDREIAQITETVKLDMKNYTGSDMKDKMSFLNTGNNLLVKLVDLQSKRFNIRNMARAQRVLVETMEQFLTPAQRTAFIQQIEGLVDVS